MAQGAPQSSQIPVPDKVLKDLAKNVANVLPNFEEEEPSTGVKKLHGILSPVLETADLADLSSSHRAAASNALCAIIEHCAASKCQHACDEILNDSIFFRALNIYLQRSNDTKGKSMRQMLLVLTGVIAKDQSVRAVELRERAAVCFLDIICEREDRIKVKPALQGLAHFLLKEVVSISQLVGLFSKQLKHSSGATDETVTLQTVFLSFLAWVVHHDTALSAGHLIKNFLSQARRSPDYWKEEADGKRIPLWIEPVVVTLREWPDRIQEFKTHVFPHCFLPDISEYTRFLAYLQFGLYVPYNGGLPDELSQSGKHASPIDGAMEFKFLLAAIATGKELTILKDSDHRVQSSIEIRDGAVYLPDNIAGKWMSDPEPEVRLAGMFLSVYSTSVTRAVSGGVLEALKLNIAHLHTDTDANFRREVHGYTQKLFDRLRASTATLSKGLLKSGSTHHSRLPFPKAAFNSNLSVSGTRQQDSLLESLSFVVWYLRFLQWELRPTASYQSRITALRSLTIVLRSGVDPGIPFDSLSKSAQGQLNWAHGIQIGNKKLVRTLLDLILDPFDDVRDAAVSVLQLCLAALPENDKEVIMSVVPPFIARAETAMLRTGRADQADGVARAYGMVFSSAEEGAVNPGSSSSFSTKLQSFEHLQRQLKSTLALAHKDLSRAVDGRPVHGIFAALRYVVDQPDFYTLVSNMPPEAFSKWKHLHSDIVASVESLWTCVYHVLCADAPEGHVPDELEDEESLDTKEILSYSWRGLKEASVLLRTIVSKAPVGDAENDMMTPQLFEKLGRLCFTQLLELRHRGAFSTVSQTFAIFCRRCVTSNIPSLRALPEAWYQETLRSIQAKSDAITRRSAGIPAAMSALLAAESQTSSELFSRAMKDLTAETLVEAKSANIEESRLPQVHALNCIKEIFTTSKLSVTSEAYIGQGLELAAKTLNSPIWPLRNCGLMLFKALIERLLGSDEAQDWKERDRAKTSRFSYDNYPSLVNILLDLLEPNDNQRIMDIPETSGSPLDLHGAEGVFPALQILRQAKPPGDISKMQELVKKLIPSPHWHMRDMAARTYVSLCSSKEAFDTFGVILDSPSTGSNGQHGMLLVLKHLLKKMLRNANRFTLDRLATVMQLMCRKAPGWYTSNNCLFVRAAFLDIVSLCGMTMLRQANAVAVLNAWSDLTESVSVGPTYRINPSEHCGDELFQSSLAQVFFIDRVIMRESSLDVLVSDEYQSIGDALMLLTTQDPDTCLTALRILDTILQSAPCNSDLIVPLALILSHIHRVVLEAMDAEVTSQAQSVLATALANNHSLRCDFFSLVTQDDVVLTLSKLERQCIEAPPSNMQSGLHLLAFFLDHAYVSRVGEREKILSAIARYIRLLRMTIVDTNPFDTRFAAVQSLYALHSILTTVPSSKSTRAIILGLSLVLYDLLNDDDDEIRDLAARTTGFLLRAQGYPSFKDTVPVLSSYRLALFLCRAFDSTSSAGHELATQALRRLTNPTPARSRLFHTPFAQVFAEERQEDTALFAQEKQNLYKDDVLDAMLWSRVLLRVPRSTVNATLRAGLAKWVADGLGVLTQTAREEADGALGWSSKPEVFTLGMRVICGAEIVVGWGDVKERGDVMVALGRFLQVARDRAVHGLWIERIETVTQREVVRMLSRVKVSMEGMQCA